MTILHIDSSINGANSASRAISQSIVDQLTIERGGGVVRRRDLVSEPLPHLTLDAFADTSVLDEFLAAETVVIGAPMYNFTLPTQLKAWLDRILVAGKTFRYTADGPEGLATGKTVIVASARGGFYGADTPRAAFDFQEPYLRQVFGFVGIDDVTFVRSEGIAIGPDQRQAAIDAALAAIPGAVAPFLPAQAA